MTNQNENPLGPGRDRTDKSLLAERAKTDEALAKVTEKSEQRTDDAVAENRMHSDEAKSRVRVDSDNSSDFERADALLRQERQTSDEALENERRRTDSFFADERNLKRLAEQVLLKQERLETDKDLFSERNETDIEVRLSEEKLVKERENHTVTKTALTTREEFLAIVSHDLRNPLASISTGIELLRKRFHNSEDEIAKRFIDLIGRSAEEALRLISDLIDMECISAGKLSMETAPHNLNELIQHSIEKFEHIASAKTLSLQFKTSPNPAVAFCDRDRSTQVLSNLLSNAIKFTPEGGTIMVSVRSFQNEFIISVEDNGPGIQSDDQALIFERFSQIKKADRRGLGLGLHISKMIVEAQAGKIWVDSKFGHGSTFCFSLPKYLSH